MMGLIALMFEFSSSIACRSVVSTETVKLLGITTDQRRTFIAQADHRCKAMEIRLFGMLCLKRLNKTGLDIIPLTYVQLKRMPVKLGHHFFLICRPIGKSELNAEPYELYILTTATLKPFTDCAYPSVAIKYIVNPLQTKILMKSIFMNEKSSLK